MAMLTFFFVMTGVIAFFLLLSAFVGWKKARSNQARYGPRPAIAGRPRQTRGKGLALAVLESIPIVKFGSSRNPDTVPKDFELEEGEIIPNRSTTTIADKLPNESNGISAKQATQTLEAESPPEVNFPLKAAPQIESSEKECSICISEFADKEEVRVLPCNHRFHPACIDPWLLSISGTCPICRYSLHPIDSTSPQEEESPSENPFRPELSPIRYVREQALLERAWRARNLESAALNRATVAVPSPTLPHPRDRTSIRSRLRELRQAHIGPEHVSASVRENQRQNPNSQPTLAPSSPSEAVTGESRPS